MSEEIWKWHPEFEGIAQVSTWGQVKTVDRWVTYANGTKRFFKGRILKPQRDRDGYLYVMLSRNGKQRKIFIHRLVAETFIPNPEEKPQVNHLDEQKDNDVVENLSWASAKENNAWGTARKRTAASLSKPVLAIDPKTGQVVKEFSSAKEARRKGFHPGSISNCCRGMKCRTHKGFVWKYKDDYDQESAWTPVKIGAVKAVLALDPKTGKVVMEFPSAAEAQRKGFSPGAISNCCLGKIKSHKGFVWRYKDDYDQEKAWTPVKIGMESVAASLSKPIQAIDPKTGEVVLEFQSAREAGRKGFDRRTICRCCRGKKSYKTHKGYIWRFKES